MLEKVLNRSWVYWVAALVILMDQYTKFLVRQNLPVGAAWMPLEWLAPYFRLVHIENTGAAFGMFPAGGQVFSVIAVVVSAVIIYYATRLPPGHWALRTTLGLQLGGAIGNLIDRLVKGPVTDFFNVLSLWNTPVFNVADLSITTGVLVLIVLMWRDSRRSPASVEATAAPEAAPTPSPHD
ncbi:MAG: signal peptidase II [Anaerolineales bacterium]|nr:signal peptidase II [Anaerolineales bacterium]